MPLVAHAASSPGRLRIVLITRHTTCRVLDEPFMLVVPALGPQPWDILGIPHTLCIAISTEAIGRMTHSLQKPQYDWKLNLPSTPCTITIKRRLTHFHPHSNCTQV